MAEHENYIMVLETSLENDDGTTTDYSATFDVITNDSVSSELNVTEQPMVNGDLVSDHAYRSPYTQSVSGSFSLNGNKRSFFPDSKNRLAEIETFFEDIQKQAALCNISIRSGSGDDIRFKARKNMVLKSASWTHSYNALSFTMTFQEVIRVSVLEALFDEDSVEEGIPALSDPETLDFTDNVLDMDEVDQSILKLLLDEGLVTEDWLYNFSSWFSVMDFGIIVKDIAAVLAGYIATTIITSAAIGTAVLAIQGIFAVAAAVGTIPGPGWVVAIVGVIAGAAALAIVGVWNLVTQWINSNKYAIRAFTDATESEYERFLELLVAIHLEMDALEEDIQSYRCPADEEQQCLLTIDDNYYVFTFTRNTPASENYKMVVTDIDENELDSMPDITAAPDSLFSLNSSNVRFTTSTGKYVYILNNAHDANNQEVEEGDDQDLTNYVILVTTFDMQELKDRIENIIKDYIFN